MSTITPEQAMTQAKIRFSIAAQAVLENRQNAVELATDALRAVAQAQAWAKLEKAKAQSINSERNQSC